MIMLGLRRIILFNVKDFFASIFYLELTLVLICIIEVNFQDFLDGL